VGVKEQVAHWRWRLRQIRSEIANALGRPFVYRHPVLGRFVYHPSDDLSRHLLLYDFEPAELQFAVTAARRGGTILDVGANIGAFTVACARAAGLDGRVIALEPSPATFAKLRVTCSRLHLPNVTLMPVAAAAENGHRQFVVSETHELRQHLADARNDGDERTVTVESRRLDDVCADCVDKVSLLKIDVEGHEFEALSGAPRILDNGRAELIVEVFPNALEAAGATADALRELLSRTHTCTTIVRQDGTVLPGTSRFETAVSQETFNTFWTPRHPRG
jgi:FkbM family methyltransferase